ncbi:MAG TPA: hypothetical protein ENL15_00340, partial [Firmicutes bacterium]|nr:hypothetical protein [Bacillota bacterium]
MAQTLVSLIPTFVTILVAYKSRKVWLALFFGIVAGGLLYGRGAGIFLTVGRYLLSGFTDPDRLK